MASRIIGVEPTDLFFVFPSKETVSLACNSIMSSVTVSVVVPFVSSCRARASRAHGRGFHRPFIPSIVCRSGVHFSQHLSPRLYNTVVVPL